MFSMIFLLLTHEEARPAGRQGPLRHERAQGSFHFQGIGGERGGQAGDGLAPEAGAHRIPAPRSASPLIPASFSEMRRAARRRSAAEAPASTTSPAQRATARPA